MSIVDRWREMPGTREAIPRPLDISLSSRTHDPDVCGLEIPGMLPSCPGCLAEVKAARQAALRHTLARIGEPPADVAAIEPGLSADRLAALMRDRAELFLPILIELLAPTIRIVVAEAILNAEELVHDQ